MFVEDIGISFSLFLGDVSVADAIGSARHPALLIVTLSESSVAIPMFVEIAVAAAIFRLFHSYFLSL